MVENADACRVQRRRLCHHCWPHSLPVQWDGYSFEDKFFPGGPFVLDAEFLAWFLFWPAVPVIVAASYLFFKTRAASSRRTASFERNLRAALKDGCIRLISVEWSAYVAPALPHALSCP